MFILFTLSIECALASRLKPAFLFGGELGGGSTRRIDNQRIGHDVDAGAGFIIGGGINYTIANTAPHSYETMLTIAYNSWWDENAEGERDRVTTWESIPIDLMYYYYNTRNQFRIGYGFSYRLANSLTDQGTLPKRFYRFKDTLGYVVAFEGYAKNPNNENILAIGFRYTFIDYEESASRQRIDGDSFGFYYAFLFDI